MPKAKNQGEASSPEELNDADVETLVRVRNTREGSIHLLPYGAFEIPAGVSEHPLSKFKSLSRHVHEQITDFELEGVLVLGEEPEVEVPAADARPALPEGFQPLPGDDGLAVETVKREPSAAMLDAWFALESHRAVVSDAIFARLTELGSK